MCFSDGGMLQADSHCQAACRVVSRESWLLSGPESFQKLVLESWQPSWCLLKLRLEQGGTPFPYQEGPQLQVWLWQVQHRVPWQKLGTGLALMFPEQPKHKGVLEVIY